MGGLAGTVGSTKFSVGVLKMTNEEIREYVVASLVELLKAHHGDWERLTAAKLLMELCDIKK